MKKTIRHTLIVIGFALASIVAVIVLPGIVLPVEATEPSENWVVFKPNT